MVDRARVAGMSRRASTDSMPAIQEPELLRRLLRAKDRMDAASHEDWPVKRLAAVSHVSEAHFARSFKQAFGIPPHRYLLTRRIERAMALLRESDLPITEIAFQTGWQSLGTFGRIFRDITGESPGRVREHEREHAQVPTQKRTPGHTQTPTQERTRVAANGQGGVPGCHISAARRPDLTIAVLEKRRRMAVDINDSSVHSKEPS
jgi:AraC-like DNA-binding protein